MNELVSPLEQRAEGVQQVEGAELVGGSRVSRARVLVLQSLGPLTALGGIVWAVAQPYRIVFLHDTGKGLWDYLGQAPLLVVLVGLVFTFLIAPGLLDDLRTAAAAGEGDDGAPR
jgi:hypothetical protein